jgi:hypothetical protein
MKSGGQWRVLPLPNHKQLGKYIGEGLTRMEMDHVIKPQPSLHYFLEGAPKKCHLLKIKNSYKTSKIVKFGIQ